MSRPEPSVALFTDLYELTMAQAYWQSDHVAPATFSFFFRKYPPNRAYFVCAGLADVLAYLERLQFSATDLDYLHSLGRFDGSFLDWLGRLRFTGSVRAMTEGTLFFTHEPVLEVTAPVIEAQLVETYVVNQLHFQTLLATKAARVRYAAGERLVIDFAARRAHGVEAADRLARVSYLAGFDGTSNTLAGARYNIPVYGTMAHSFVTAFTSEAESFRAYARSFPDSSTLLVDTYDTLAGTRKAVAVARELREQGHRLQALRLDSGDLAVLAREARALLDGAGFPEVRLFASGGLDEYEVEALVRSAAPIDGFGVGTKVGVSADAPLADCAYKLVAYDGRPVLKLSPGKQTLPGPKQVYRFRDDQGSWVRDMIARADEPAPGGGAPLLVEVMRGGKRLRPDPALAELRRAFREQFARLPERHKALRSPTAYEVGLSPELERLRDDVVRQITEHELGG
ncbi:MAG: nicotinate phosphoribosyltransferase [Gemmataceae bacterium]|nr:nicotinate phosphoribosyltransferase [Gemmataceae bacterium]